jgi:hypothetical protein
MQNFLAAAGFIALIGAGAGIAKADGDQAKSRSERGVLTLYEGKGFNGKRYEVDTLTREMDTVFAISSIAVHPGESWQICERPAFKEPCMTVDADQENLNAIMVRSAKPVKK